MFDKGIKIPIRIEQYMPINDAPRGNEGELGHSVLLQAQQ